jgi:GT2 family glycosyltransferase
MAGLAGVPASRLLSPDRVLTGPGPAAQTTPSLFPSRATWSPAGFWLLEVRELKPPGPAEGPAELLIGGGRALPPLCVLQLEEGIALVLARAPRSCPAEGAALTLLRGGRVLARTRAEAGGDPAVATAALLLDRPAAARAALLRRLLTTAAMTFRAQADPGFAALCHPLAAALAEGAPAARVLAGGAGGPSLWRLPRVAGTAEGGAWRLLSPDAPLRRLAGPAPGGNLLLADGALPVPGALLLPPEGAPIPVAAPAGAFPPSLLDLARRGGVARSALLELVARRSEAGDAAAALLLRDLQLLAPSRATSLADPALPVGGALELALPDGEGGVFLRGWLRDPLRLVESLELRGPGGTVALPHEALHRLPRPDLAEALRAAPQGDGGPRPGFVAHLAQPGFAPGSLQFALELRLGSGQRLTLAAPPGALPPTRARDLVLGTVDPAEATPALLDACLSPAIARLHRAAMAEPGTSTRIDLGPAPRARRRPAATVVVPLYKNLSFLRAQLAGFARDPAFRGATAPELVYVLDSPEQRAEVEALLHGLALLHALPLTLLVQDRNRGYAAACNAGAAIAGAPLLLMLNSDVLPEAPGWFAPLRRRLSRDARLAALGPKLLYADGTAIQHAGLCFAPMPDGSGWGSNHYFKGWPRHHAPACRARRVPAVTGAAMLLRRDAFEAVGGFCTDYVLGDFEDSDLCLKLRARGHEIGYEPASELLHLERQSIGAHPAHAGTLAAAHNRRLHEQRWGAEIAALMRRFPHPRGS